jgi:ketosteroid isomerase-like protein
MSDEKLIQDLIAEVEPAMRDGDADRIAARYTADAVSFTLAPPLRQPEGAAADPAGVVAWIAGQGGTVDYRVTELRVSVGGDVAFAHSLNRMADGRGVFELWFRATYGLRRTSDGWRIAHEHQSTPFYMDGSFAAALDLKP